ncbi:V-type ATP synthase subunit E [Alkalibacterium pelagium]|uniref:V/A-type H+-transporting ATPase subunit E n=1 Tax=Alkalibacterium pelagium TaxID=426702 RepID=A0A1H7GI57_9LACT|nr:V-type ATP synthase subunit E family protein [Alkalibacterium pelagium]GEN49795.1 V-type sodium ATP synthase subunit E [Alkalibacterium pelagium]SEK37724.1 V/A-type H+-transporting ATPase subunit E [Alkalibacterium pelagium]
MADLKLLTERVVEKEKAAIRTEIEEAKKQAEDDIQAAEAEEVQKRLQAKEQIKADAEHDYTIRRNTLDIRRRNEVLAAKQSILNNTFKEAKYKLDNLDKETFRQFTANVLKQFTNEEQVTLKLGEKSAHSIDGAWVTANKPAELTVLVSDETVKGQSGFLIEKNGIEYNFLFDSLVEDAKTDILPDISNELF